jgi:uncharacterized protein (DUF302 family)
MIDKEKKILAEEPITKAMEKVKKEKVEININPKKFLLAHSKSELEKLEKAVTDGMNEAELKLLADMKVTYTANIVKYSAAKLEAVLVPLKYRDLQAIKDSVLEAIKYAMQFSWDDDIKMRAMIREEHTMTVYLALRKKDNLNEHYYSSLEEIALEVENTIEELYAIYVDTFVLTDDERKNL